MKNSGKRKFKFKMKSVFKVACIVLLCVTMSVLAVNISGAFNKEINTDNLIKYENYTNKNEEFENGLRAKWNDDGTFVLWGKPSDDSMPKDSFHEHVFLSMELDAGIYTFTTGNDNCDEDSYHLFVKVDGKYYRAWSDRVHVEVEQTSTVLVGFAVKNDYRILYAKFAPVLVAGTETGSFWAE